MHSSASSASTRSGSARSRVTTFTSNRYVPDLNMFTAGPGPGKYSRPNSSQDLTLIGGPAFSFGKEERYTKRLLKEKTPEHYYYPIKDRGPSYVIGRLPKSTHVFMTPAPTHYSPEKSYSSIRPTAPVCRIGTAERFAKNYISIF